MTTYTQKLSALLLAAGLALPVVTLAAGNGATVTIPPVGVAVDSATDTPKVAAKLDAKIAPAIVKGDKEIDRRVKALTDLAARLGATQRVTATFKQTLTTNVQNQINGLTQLKAKIDADTDLETLKTDIKTITESYRTFAMVMPQTNIAVAADREVTLVAMLNQLGAKLQARVQAAGQSGADVTKITVVLKDMSDKLADADIQVKASVSVSASLTPDNGDKDKMTANQQALKTARADIEASHKDLLAARKDAEQVIKALKSLPTPTTNASSTTSTTPTH